MSERARLILRLLTAFVLGIVSLTLEIAYTRVISFKLFYYYTYFVIGLALLGLGAASAVVALSTKLRSLDTAQLLQRVAPAASFVGLLGYMVVARLPMTTDKIWSGTTSETIGQIIRLLVLSLSLTAVFFADRTAPRIDHRRRGRTRPPPLLLGSPRCRPRLSRRRSPPALDRSAGDDHGLVGVARFARAGRRGDEQPAGRPGRWPAPAHRRRVGVLPQSRGAHRQRQEPP